MNQLKPRLLCVDDDRDSLELIKFWLEQHNFEVSVCSLPENCLSEIRRNEFAAIILDNYLEKDTGLEMCREIRSIKPDLPIIFYSGEARQTEIDKILKAGANAYLIKPTGFDELVPVTLELIQCH